MIKGKNYLIFCLSYFKILLSFCKRFSLLFIVGGGFEGFKPSIQFGLIIKKILSLLKFILKEKIIVKM